jgi:predicted dehydrogenase
MSGRRRFLMLSASTFAPSLSFAQSLQAPFRLAVAGLVHGHARGFMNLLQRHPEVHLAGVSDPSEPLRQSYAERFKIPQNQLFASIDEMLDRTRPEAVALFGSTFDHPAGVEACAARRIPVMMEKPLAVSLEHATRIERAARQSGIPVIVNYETTWYRSHAALWRFFREQKAAGAIRKMVAMDGHMGPREIGVGPEFFSWLTDPKLNCAGALFDFGCYGANLMTWMLDNARPLSVTARTLQIKPKIYPHVDDEATVVLDYPSAQGIIQASWNWPYHRKDFEVYGESGYAHAIGGNLVRLRTAPREPEQVLTPPELPPDEADAIAYLRAVTRGRLKPSGLSSLENNLIATEILVAARESARTGRAVALPGK